MSFKLNLRSPLFDRARRRRALDQVVQDCAAELEAEIKQKILDGPKTGRLNRKGPITKAATKGLLKLGLRKANGKSNRVVAGSLIHRASAPGQSPASDTGGLLNSIRSDRTGDMKAKVSTSKEYAAALDDGANAPAIRGGRRSKRKPGAVRNLMGPHRGGIAPRPFFKVTVKEYEPKFKERVQAAISKLT